MLRNVNCPFVDAAKRYERVALYSTSYRISVKFLYNIILFNYAKGQVYITFVTFQSIKLWNSIIWQKPHILDRLKIQTRGTFLQRIYLYRKHIFTVTFKCSRQYQSRIYLLFFDKLENGTFLNVKYFSTFPIPFFFPSKSTQSKRPGDFLKAYLSARTVSTVITTLCQHFSLYLPTTYLPTYLPRRLFAPLWGFKYVDVEIAVLWLSFFPLSSSSRSESSETLFVVPSSRKLTVQAPAVFPTAPFLPTRFSPYVLGCYGSSGRFLCRNNRICGIQRLQNSRGVFRDTLTMRWAFWNPRTRDANCLAVLIDYAFLEKSFVYNLLPRIEKMYKRAEHDMHY